MCSITLASSERGDGGLGVTAASFRGLAYPTSGVSP